jgi:hypothetical protein
MSKLILRRNSDGGEVSLEDSLVLKAFTADGVTNVQYLEEAEGYRKIVKVSDALDNVGGMSGVLTVTTDLDGDTIWVNKNRVSGVSEKSSLATLRFDGSGASPDSIKLNTTSAAWNNAVIAKEGGFSYVVDSFTAAPNVVVLDAAEGDVTAKFVSGVFFTVFGEGDANDTIFSVVSSAFTSTTNITVTETPIVNASAAGYAWVK